MPQPGQRKTHWQEARKQLELDRRLEPPKRYRPK